jgi:hypothetical protein
MSDAKAKITLGGDTAIELDVLKGTLGQDVIDIRSLGSKGVFTLTQVSHPPLLVNLKLRLSMVTRGSCCTAASRSTS